MNGEADKQNDNLVDDQLARATESTMADLMMSTVVETMRLRRPPHQATSTTHSSEGTGVLTLPRFPAVPADSFSVETTPRYREDGLIGRGGGGVVFRGIDRHLQRSVACKVLRSHRQQDESKRRRFVREARITARLAHPGIVPVLDCGEDETGLPWYSMRLAEGADLAHLIAEAEHGQVAERIAEINDRVALMLQVCSDWRRGHYDLAISQAESLIDSDPTDRIALLLLNQRPEPFPQAITHRLLQLLAHSTEVRHLHLSKMGIRDLSPLANMPLRHLHLDDNPCQDLSPLHHQSLTHLSIANCQVQDLSPLRGMPLQRLSAGNNPFSDLRPLHGLPLRYLDLRECPNLQDLSPLADCADLIDLTITDTGIRQLDAIAGLHLTQLTVNDLTQDPSSILANMPLQTCAADNCQIRSLDFCRGKDLRNLNLAENAITSIEALHGLPLRNLDLSDNQITQLDTIASLPHLVKLTANDNPLTATSRLDAPRLRDLAIQDTQLQTLPIMPSGLVILSTVGSPLTDASSLAGLRPQTIDLSGHRLPVAQLAAVQPQHLAGIVSEHWQPADYQALLQAWRQAGLPARVLRDVAATQVALTGDADAAWRMSEQHGDRRRLRIPIAMTFPEAQQLARRLGAWAPSCPASLTNSTRPGCSI